MFHRRRRFSPKHPSVVATGECWARDGSTLPNCTLGRQVSSLSKLCATATPKIQTLGRGQTVTSPPPGLRMQIRAPGSSWDLSAEPSDSQFLSRRARPPAARSGSWSLRARRAAASSPRQAGRPRQLGPEPAAPRRASAPPGPQPPSAGPAGPPRRAPRSELKSPWSAAAAAPAAPQLSPRAGESQARAGGVGAGVRADPAGTAAVPLAAVPGAGQALGRGPGAGVGAHRGRRGRAPLPGCPGARPGGEDTQMSSALGDPAPRGEDAGACSSAGVSSPELRRGVVGGEGAGGGEAPRSPPGADRRAGCSLRPGQSWSAAGKPPPRGAGAAGLLAGSLAGTPRVTQSGLLPGPGSPEGRGGALSQTRGQLPSLGAGAAA